MKTIDDYVTGYREAREGGFVPLLKHHTERMLGAAKTFQDWMTIYRLGDDYEDGKLLSQSRQVLTEMPIEPAQLRELRDMALARRDQSLLYAVPISYAFFNNWEQLIISMRGEKDAFAVQVRARLLRSAETYETAARVFYWAHRNQFIDIADLAKQRVYELASNAELSEFYAANNKSGIKLRLNIRQEQLKRLFARLSWRDYHPARTEKPYYEGLLEKVSDELLPQ